MALILPIIFLIFVPSHYFIFLPICRFPFLYISGTLSSGCICMLFAFSLFLFSFLFPLTGDSSFLLFLTWVSFSHSSSSRVNFVTRGVEGRGTCTCLYLLSHLPSPSMPMPGGEVGGPGGTGLPSACLPTYHQEEEVLPSVSSCLPPSLLSIPNCLLCPHTPLSLLFSSSSLYCLKYFVKRYDWKQ